MGEKHSKLVRGLQAAGEDRQLIGGKFGRLFPNLPVAKYGSSAEEENRSLTALATAMISELDPPKDAPDDEESGIPALYTYFGQFIDHDLTYDPNSTFQKKKDPDATKNFRTAAFDMDNIYGRGPGDQPYMYDTDGKSFLLGGPITQGKPAGAHDLQRNGAGRALIGDPRNDENAIVSQLQALVLRFHNRMVKQHHNASFEHVQELVRHHYQYVVINDFLPRIVSAGVLNSLKNSDGIYDKSKLQIYTSLKDPFIPIEFSTAAYRLGHSMIRPGYRLNDTVLLPIFPLPANETTGQVPLPEGLTGFRRLISDWALDWGRFIDLDIRHYGKDTKTPTQAQTVQNNQRLQFAYRIDTALVEPLHDLPASVAGNPPPSLALRNLMRGREFGLPSGQEVAQAIGVEPLRDDAIKIGQGILASQHKLPDISTIADGAFKGNCPLWTYILAEAMQHQVPVHIPVTGGQTISTPQLGPVGGRIVAEVFLGLMFADGGSYLSKHPHWAPDDNPAYRLKDFIGAALGLPPAPAHPPAPHETAEPAFAK
jgi:hypothetical protein